MRLFTLFVLIGFISGQVSSYSGTSSQNNKLYKLRPELRGEQFYKRVIAWQTLSSRYTDLDNLELIEHEIVSGESFWGISNYYDISFDDLIEINKIKEWELAIVGRRLIIPIQKNILPNINDTSERDPCNDAKYLALHEKGVDNLTDDEFDYYIDIFVRCPGSRKPNYAQKKAVQKQTVSKSLLNEKKLNKVSELALVESKSSKKSSNSTYKHKKE